MNPLPKNKKKKDGCPQKKTEPWQLLRFVTLGFYHDQMFRAVFKALEATNRTRRFSESLRSGMRAGRMRPRCRETLCPALGT